MEKWNKAIFIYIYSKQLLFLVLLTSKVALKCYYLKLIFDKFI